MRQILNNFTIIKSITIIFVYVSKLKKKHYLIFFYSHAQKLSEQQSFFSILQYVAPCFFFFFHCAAPSKKTTYKPYINNPSRRPILIAHKYKIHLNSWPWNKNTSPYVGFYFVGWTCALCTQQAESQITKIHTFCKVSI